MNKPLLSFVIPCYNEEENIGLLIAKVKDILRDFEEKYRYEIIVIDNDSADRSAEIVKQECTRDKRVKLIVNSRNFGWIRSPYYALLQAKGDAVMLLAADFQDPPELIPQFIRKWEEGFKIVIGVKDESDESALMFAVRKLYYHFIDKISSNKLFKNFTGFGLYDKKIITALKSFDDPYPYFRGLISEVGFQKAVIHFRQPTRKRGISASNFYALYDVAMLGITSYSKFPLRFATMVGFIMSGISFIIALVYLFLKLTYWYNFPAGNAPTVIGLFFIGSVQLFFIGILGEYIGAIHTIVQKRPLVIEKERVNFDDSAE
ncbi:MAG: glycosyltransferase family 2 protein [Chitinophagales bacterium]|nr:glycosyltransferase family 2 protein [Chitinophagales bacterium]MDW8418778.1 glycosyltransferase family 2 protein [Chitinophagales bacterium]